MTEQKQLPARVGQGVALNSVSDIKEMAQMLFASGCFNGQDVAKACLKIVAGMEYGFTPYIAMTGIHIIEGKPTLSSNLVAAAIKRSGRYDYRVKKMDDTGCSIEMFEKGVSLGISSFTMKDAEKAGLKGKQNWNKYPRQMCFARTITEAARTFAPDIFGGPVYTPEDFDVVTNGNEIVEGQVVESELPKSKSVDSPAIPSATPAGEAESTSTAQSAATTSEPPPTLTQEIEQADEISFEDEVSIEECKARIKEACLAAGYKSSAIGVVLKAHFQITTPNFEEKIRQALGDVIEWFKTNPSPNPGEDVKFDVNGFAIKNGG
mgnify:CR=1 FL=1